MLPSTSRIVRDRCLRSPRVDSKSSLDGQRCSECSEPPSNEVVCKGQFRHRNFIGFFASDSTGGHWFNGYRI